MKNHKEIMKLLKVESIAFLIAKTNQGELSKVLRLKDNDYHYTLDSVTLDNETAEALIKLL